MLGKTFLTAVFCVYKCILYPGTKVIVCARTRGQGTQVLENIAERFSILVTFHEPDLLIIPISFLVFELLRVCFDSKMTLT